MCSTAAIQFADAEGAPDHENSARRSSPPRNRLRVSDPSASRRPVGDDEIPDRAFVPQRDDLLVGVGGIPGFRVGTGGKLDNDQARMRPFAFKNGQMPPARDELPAKRHHRRRYLLAVQIERRLIVNRFGGDHIGLHSQSSRSCPNTLNASRTLTAACWAIGWPASPRR